MFVQNIKYPYRELKLFQQHWAHQIIETAKIINIKVMLIDRNKNKGRGERREQE
jgi:hypothetical protein